MPEVEDGEFDPLKAGEQGLKPRQDMEWQENTWSKTTGPLLCKVCSQVFEIIFLKWLITYLENNSFWKKISMRSGVVDPDRMPYLTLW